VRAEKLRIGFASDCFGQHRFAGSRRADEQHSFGQGASETLVFLRVPQKIYNFLNLGFRFFNPRHVAETDDRPVSHL
jgi:hypothetical protein